ncbi:MAG: sigma 54-interacting transcriptional regulator [Pseudomonadota bacterium]
MLSQSSGRKRRALVVDPSSTVRASIWMILKEEFEVLTTSNFPEAIKLAGREEVEIVVAGVDLPPVFYSSFFHDLRKTQPRLPFLLLLGERASWGKKLDLPGSDWLDKPFPVQTLREKIQALLLEKDWGEKSRPSRISLSAEEKIKSWLYSSRMQPEVREKVFKVSFSSLPVFIQGEEGTGKSEVAKAIHFLGPFKDTPFIRFFCRELTLEKFMRKLSFWLQNSGRGENVSLTLFLEEVENLEWDVQSTLLDLWKDQWIGWPGLEEIGIEAKIITTSTTSLAQAISAGKLRGELYQTLKILPINLQPLRDRQEDIPRLATEILQEHRQEQISRKKFSQEALQVLQQYHWPGNLRELESLTLRSAALKEGELLLPEDLIFCFGRGELWIGSREEKEKDEGRFSSAMPAAEKESLFDATLSTLAHEIKNPLVAISTFAALLPEKYDDPEFREQFSRLVNLDVKRINELLENLLEFAQFPSPRIRENNLTLILKDVLKEKEKKLTQRGTRLRLDWKENLPAILIDPVQLEFVLRNILENVLATIEEDKDLSFSMDLIAEGEGQKNFVELVVWYDGQDGIIRNIQKAFGPEAGLNFENVSLALALVRKVMIRNRGDMLVSQEEGAGTTIRLRFSVAG